MRSDEDRRLALSSLGAGLAGSCQPNSLTVFEPVLADQAEFENPRTSFGALGQVDSGQSVAHLEEVAPYMDNGKSGYWLRAESTHPPKPFGNICTGRKGCKIKQGVHRNLSLALLSPHYPSQNAPPTIPAPPGQFPHHRR